VCDPSTAPGLRAREVANPWHRLDALALGFLGAVAEAGVVDPGARFAVDLKAARAERGLSQMDLSRRCGLNLTAISKIESGGRDPRLGTIIKLAQGLGLPAGRLLDGLPAGVEA
jgi:DNA-binding XRE family transcriptional regulator